MHLWLARHAYTKTPENADADFPIDYAEPRRGIESSMHLFIPRTRACPLYTADNRRIPHRGPAPKINWHFNLAIRVCHRPLIYLSLPADLPRATRLIYFDARQSSSESLRLIAPISPAPRPWILIDDPVCKIPAHIVANSTFHLAWFSFRHLKVAQESLSIV